MLRAKTKRVFTVEDIDSISAQAQQCLGSDNTNRRFLKSLLHATRYAVENELTHRQHQCFTLHYYKGLAVKDIAAQLGIDCSTVSRHIRAARERIRSHAHYCVFAYRDSPHSFDC
ncbi:RNA polymerase sigma factor (sigma-70 family) [Hydrogenoanaerobacterium saccharovorans]|uniref:RNA polymerase sigma factor, sigma-70 family n=1 Tax=Hydrogenoanaerobacterium saccharovorans TaxID=474960 RepID=A0A1H8B1K6_9FIRM|nr:sigma factor-like helix-turn-helix DNA-binding protein [Hydrogenoanaerobacterium saccharovorans]RPF47636.1 RNA polymerase sigma factor (sigma-70 family) [Hydrogenoanaerobacterium saccharovorans]SEM76790.1 RNA polymerase sigma factor, sigma-70 family [Hydrogenoanaerobacterium saccharovorans]